MTSQTQKVFGFKILFIHVSCIVGVYILLLSWRKWILDEREQNKFDTPSSIFVIFVNVNSD